MHLPYINKGPISFLVCDLTLLFLGSEGMHAATFSFNLCVNVSLIKELHVFEFNTCDIRHQIHVILDVLKHVS